MLIVFYYNKQNIFNKPNENLITKFDHIILCAKKLKTFSKYIFIAEESGTFDF